MDRRRIDQVGLVAAGVAWASIAVIEVLVVESPFARPGLGMLWWLVWLAFGATYLSVQLGPDAHGPAQRSRRLIVLGAVVPLGVGVVLLSGLEGYSGVALVMSAVLVAQFLPAGPALAVIVAQTAAVVVPPVLLDGPGAAPGAVATGTAYLAFQLFAFVMVSAVRDVERARAETEAAHAALQQAQAQLADTSRAAERLRIARDLHDAIGHQLTALSLQLQVAAHGASGQTRDQLEMCREVAADLLRDVRAVVGQLREDQPAGPADLPGLLAALGAAVPRPTVHVDVDPDLPQLPAAQADVLCRCVQEVITNAARHSGADNLWVAVEELDGVATVTARDDGRGSGGVQAGHGLTGMAERFAAYGGTVAWHGAPGEGFTVQASLPVRVVPA
jgi:signal transduction histidine kinase